MSNLAKAMAHQGKYTEARGLAQGTLQVREKVLGKEHPGTLRSMSDLGWVLFSKHEQFGIGTGRPGKLRDTHSKYMRRIWAKTRSQLPAT